MKKFLSITLTLAVISLYFGFISPTAPCNCKPTGQNPPITEVRKLSGFTAINAVFNGKIELTQADEDKVTIIADEEILSSIVTEVKEGTLYITSKETPSSKRKTNHGEIKVLVSVRQLKSIKNNSNGAFVSTNPLTSEKLSVSNASNGEMVLKLNVPSLQCNSDANGRFVLEGNATHAEINNAMNGQLEASDLVVENLTLNNTANGMVTVNANQSLVINQTGNGVVFYKGKATPKITNSGFGAIQKK